MTDLRDELLGPTHPNESPQHYQQRGSQALRTAEEVVLSDLEWLPAEPDPEGESDPDLEAYYWGWRRSPGPRTRRPRAGPPRTRLPFRPQGQADLAPRGNGAKLAANLAALEVLRTLDAEKRLADEDEQATLARWSGWGALPAVFDPAHAERDIVRAELAELLGPARLPGGVPDHPERAPTPTPPWPEPSGMSSHYRLVERCPAALTPTPPPTSPAASPVEPTATPAAWLRRPSEPAPRR